MQHVVDFFSDQEDVYTEAMGDGKKVHNAWFAASTFASAETTFQAKPGRWESAAPYQYSAALGGVPQLDRNIQCLQLQQDCQNFLVLHVS